jgi:hypothetical protein
MVDTTGAPILQCVLHVEGEEDPPNEVVIPFNKKSWETAGTIAKARRQYQKASKYLLICDSIDFEAEPQHYYGFHGCCYSRFTAYQIPSKQKNVSTEDYSIRRRSYIGTNPVACSSTTGVLEKKCIFCGGSGRKHFTSRFEILTKCETKTAQLSIKKAAEQLEDVDFLHDYEQINFLTKEVHYHNTCRARYISKAARAKEDDTMVSYQKVRKSAFDRVVVYVEENIFIKQSSEKLTDINDIFIKYLKEEGHEDPTSTAAHLLSKLKEHFGGKLEVQQASKKQGIILSFAKDAMEKEIRNVALFFRDQISKLNENKLPNPITEESICHGQTETLPMPLLEFYRILYTGSRDLSSAKVERYIEASAEDDIYKATSGRVKPAKHMLLAMGLKSLTGSRKILEIVNHFGHCVGYHTAEEYETQIATTILERNKVLPDGLQPQEGLCTGTAWDNYDESMFHDTQGICIQNEAPVLNDTADPSSIETPQDITTYKQSTTSKQPKKRSLDISKTDLEPVRKKVKISHFSFQRTVEDEPVTYKLSVFRDISWTICCKENKSTPMWSGWNSMLTRDDLPTQKIGYLANIGEPPTRLDVVNETMKRNLAIAEECKEKYITTTYDLAIAKPASQLQDTMQPKFDNIFICFGAFHIMFRYLSAVGKLIDGSGAAYILTESGALTKGSVNAFLSGKHFNQTRRMHVLLASCMRSKHIDLFLRLQDGNTHYLHMVDILKNLQETPTPERMDEIEKTNDYISFMESYETFCRDTEAGKHGANAQFWMNYINMVDIYMLFSRAVRTNDVELFCFMLGQMIDIFFAANKPNYSRYMCLYYLRLLNMDITHPGIRQQLEQGGLSVRLATNSFARQPVDQALESTINADAASRQTGITSFHQSLGATKRWTLTRSARSNIVRHLLEKAGITKQHNPSHELAKSKVTKFQSDFHSISQMIETTMNPFAESLVADSDLYCLSDGKAMPEEVKRDMIAIFVKGKKWKDDFITECTQDPSRFERPIPRQLLKTFASASIQSKLKGKDDKVLILKTTRDLLGRLVYLACTRKLDIEKVFCFPLTPVPLSLASIYGTMKKTPKHTLAKYLEDLITHQEPLTNDVVLYDAMFIIQSLPSEALTTFGKLAEVVLKNICNVKSKDIHFVCDSYVKSIKDTEQQARGATGGTFHITGADQVCPKDFAHALKSPSFKKALCRFLIEEWKNNRYGPFMKQKNIYVSHEECSLRYNSMPSGKVQHTNAAEYVCSHVEADTRLVFHLSVLSQITPGQNAVIRANDTDIMVIFLYYANMVQANIWMDIGHSSNNTRRYIHITALANHLGPVLCKALIGYHALTGCDYTSPFFRKGKVIPLKKAQKDKLHLEGLSNLGESATFTDHDNLVEKYVCSLYGQPRLSSVNEARSKIFLQRYKPSHPDSPLEKIKSLDAGMLPPCKDVMLQKFARSNYVAYLWKHAERKDPLDHMDPTDHGWKEVDGLFAPVWFTGPQMPSTLSKTMIPEDIADLDESDDDDEDDDSGNYSENDESSDDDDEDFE